MKLFISRIIETSRFLSTEAGQQLTDFINYMSELAEQTIRALRNGLNFSDNFSCKVVSLEVKTAVNQAIQADKAVFGILLVYCDQELSRWHWDTTRKLNSMSKLLSSRRPNATQSLLYSITRRDYEHHSRNRRTWQVLLYRKRFWMHGPNPKTRLL